MRKPVVLTIIDGLGYANKKEGNAWKLAKTPFLNFLLDNYPNSVIKASGAAVGLPVGQMGNSEVGHLNIGAGQIVYTGLSLIANEIKTGAFRKNPAFLKSIDHARKNKGTIHVMGLLSPGGVHSLESHLYEILLMLFDNKVQNVVVHAFTDGRDVAPRSVESSLKALMVELDILGYKLGSIQGRLYAMDRDEMFDKTEKAFEAICGQAENTFDDPLEYINRQYAKNLNDEFIEPAINPDATFLHDGDSVIFFNFRPDRARQLSHLMIGSNLYKVKPKNTVKNIQLTSMMKYEGIDNADVAFDSMLVQNTLGSVISRVGFTQLRIAETQKYAHVTFFMDGGVDITYPGEERILIPSLKIDNFAQQPKMSAQGITDALIPVLHKFDLVIMNYANPDMVGHTGDIPAAIAAIEFLDANLAQLKAKVDELEGTMFITADHGNAEEMLDEKGQPATKHTTNDVPLIVTDKKIKLDDGALANIAPTILDFMGIKVPESMDHKSLLKK